MKQIYTFLVFTIFLPLSTNAIKIINKTSRILKISNVQGNEFVRDFQVHPKTNHEISGVRVFVADIKNKIYRIQINSEDTIIGFYEIDGEIMKVKSSELLNYHTVNDIVVS